MTINAEVLAWNAAVVADVRAHGGAVAHGPMTGASILILTTIGAKSGDPRARPLAHPRDGDRFVILASNRGLHTHPAWYANLRKQPEVRSRSMERRSLRARRSPPATSDVACTTRTRRPCPRSPSTSG